MANLDAIVEAQSSLEATVSRQLAEFEKTLHSGSPKINTMDSVSTEFQKFKITIFTTICSIRKQITALTNSVDVLEMRHRRKFLLFGGIPESNGEDISALVASICQDKMQITGVSPLSFSACHRLGAPAAGRTRLVLVRCTDISLKSMIWRKKTSLKGTSYVVSEFLTRQRQAVFLQARKHFGLRRVWSNDGNVFVKLASGNIDRVVTSDQLQILMEKYPSESANVPNGDIVRKNSPLAEAEDGTKVACEPTVAATITQTGATSSESKPEVPGKPAASEPAESKTPKLVENEANRAAASASRPTRKTRKDFYAPPAPKTR